MSRAISKLITLLLCALPIAMLCGHLLAIGRVWNHATKEKFNPLTNYISDYAYRSPGWWAVIACIHGFALFFLYFSWVTAGKKRSPASWLVVAAASVVAFQLFEVAVYPVRSPELAISRLQRELDKGSFERAKDEIWRITLEARGRRVPSNAPVWTYVNSHGRDRLHVGGIQPTKYLLVVVIGISFFLWLPAHGERKRWIAWHVAALAVFAVAFATAHWKPEWPGLTQRTIYVGVYLWMWLVHLRIREKGSMQGAIEKESNDAPVTAS